MLPVLQAIGAGLGALSAIKTLTDGSDKTTSAASNATTSSSAATSAAAKATSGDAKEMEDRFLKLLVTQMKNQDPLNPLDNAQVTTQIAQISTVSGIDKLNAGLASLSSSLLTAQSAQSANLIGRQVLASGSALTLAGGKASGAIDVKEAADRVTISVMDKAGAIVRRIELGQRPAGVTAFEWDGKTDAGIAATPGSYTFQVSAAKANTSITAEALSVGRVSGVTLGSSMTLDLESGGNVAVGNVKRIF